MAQEESPPRESAGAQSLNPASSSEIRESQLETIYLKDSDGNLVPFIGALTFEEFEQAYRLYKKLNTPQQPPHSTLKSMVISGTVQENLAELKITFQISVHRDGWVPTPLRLGGVFLRSVQYEGEGRHFTQYDHQAEGYACWIDGEKESLHKVTFDAVVPVTRQGTLKRLSLKLPRANSPQLNLTMPTVQLVTDEIQGAILREPRDLGDGVSEIEAVGLGGQFELVWRDANKIQTANSMVISASGAVRVNFDGQHHISSDAKLRVQSLSGPIDSFVIRLPTGMKNVPLEQGSVLPEYEVSVLTADEKKRRKYPKRYAEAELVEVRLASKTSDSVEVSLRARLAENDMGTVAPLGSPLEASGFEVVEAERRLQWGTIDIAVQGDWSLRWENSTRVTRIGDISDTQKLGGVVARFEYSQQPCSLKVRVLPKATRISIEPIYLVQVSSEQLQLEATLNYKVSGTKGYQLKVDMSGWEFDSVFPENFLSLDSGEVDDQGFLTFSLTSMAISSADDSKLRLLAHRTIDANSPSWSFSLPRPQGTTITPATLVVLAEDNIDLTPIPDEMRGLALESTPPQVNIPSRQQQPFIYRDQSDAGMATFVGRHQVRSQSITVAVSSRVQLNERSAEIEQLLAYRIDYESFPSVVLDIPDAILLSKQISVTLDNEVLPFFPVHDERVQENSKSPRNIGDALEPQEKLQRSLVRIDLPRDRQIGSVDLLIRYSLRLPTLKRDGNVKLVLPLVIPADDDMISMKSHSLSIMNSEHLNIQIEESNWVIRGSDGSATTIQREYELTAQGDTKDLTLVASLAATSGPTTTIVRKAWLQSWLTRNQRRDRFAIRLTTVEQSLQIALPQGAQNNHIDVSFDGHRIANITLDEAGVIFIELPQDSSQSEHVLEVWYSVDEDRSYQGAMRLDAPQVVGASQAKRWYWQVVLPHDEHSILSPPGLASEMIWSWRRFYWTRRATLNQRDLENWLGASQQAPLPESSNQYLYSSFGSIGPIQLYTVSRRVIILVSSLFALVAGLLLLYIPALRHPGVLFGVAIGLLGIGFYNTEHALLFAQAASVGLVVLLAARLMDWAILRRTSGHYVVRGTSIGHLELSPSDSQFPRLDGISQVSTTTAPPVVSVGAPPDSKA